MENDKPVEVLFELPDLLEGPIELPSGGMVGIGDKVEHPEYGIGNVFRVGTYHDDLGPFVFCDFPNHPSKMIGIAFVKKVAP